MGYNETIVFASPNTYESIGGTLGKRLSMSAPPLDHDSILKAVQQWPRARQIELAREILRATEPPRQRSEAETQLPSQQPDSWARLIGVLATDQPPPTDEDIARWLEERRMERYGR